MNSTIPIEILTKFCEESKKAGFLCESELIKDDKWAYAIGHKNMSHIFSMSVIESPDNFGQVSSNFGTSMYTINDEPFYEKCDTCKGHGTIDEGPAHNWECSSCEGTGLKLPDDEND